MHRSKSGISAHSSTHPPTSGRQTQPSSSSHSATYECVAQSGGTNGPDVDVSSVPVVVELVVVVGGAVVVGGGASVVVVSSVVVPGDGSTAGPQPSHVTASAAGIRRRGIDIGDERSSGPHAARLDPPRDDHGKAHATVDFDAADRALVRITPVDRPRRRWVGAGSSWKVEVGMDIGWRRSVGMGAMARSFAWALLLGTGTGMACTIEDVERDDAELDDEDDDDRVAETPAITRCELDCFVESAICADEALVRKAKCNGDTCLRDAHRAHAAALLECKKKHPSDNEALLRCSGEADAVLIAAMMACPDVTEKASCQTEYEKDQKACEDAEKACLAACAAAPASP